MNSDQKLQKLIEIKSSLMQEIYKQCIENNINPDTFDYKNYIVNIDIFQEGTGVPESTLGAHCFKLDIINKKIKELQ